MTAVKYVKGKIKAGSANRWRKTMHAGRRTKCSRFTREPSMSSGWRNDIISSCRSSLSESGNGWQAPEVLDMHDEMCFLGEQAEFIGFRKLR